MLWLVCPVKLDTGNRELVGTTINLKRMAVDRAEAEFGLWLTVELFMCQRHCVRVSETPSKRILIELDLESAITLLFQTHHFLSDNER